MTLSIDLRASATGGIVNGSASAWDDKTTPVSPDEFARRIDGQDLQLATHGFNVNRDSGLEALSIWSQRCQLPGPGLYIGVLWPGDSRFVLYVDYVYEDVEAIASGKLLADYLNRYAIQERSLSFVSHSVGERTILDARRDAATPHYSCRCAFWMVLHHGARHGRARRV